MGKRASIGERFAKRFWSNVDMQEGSDASGLNAPCWLWVGTTFQDRGTIVLDGQTLLAKRAAYELVFDCNLKKFAQVFPFCGTKICCNPAHMNLDNAAPASASTSRPAVTSGAHEATRKVLKHLDWAGVDAIAASGSWLGIRGEHGHLDEQIGIVTETLLKWKRARGERARAEQARFVAASTVEGAPDDVSESASVSAVPAAPAGEVVAEAPVSALAASVDVPPVQLVSPALGDEDAKVRPSAPRRRFEVLRGAPPEVAREASRRAASIAAIPADAEAALQEAYTRAREAKVVADNVKKAALAEAKDRHVSEVAVIKEHLASKLASIRSDADKEEDAMSLAESRRTHEARAQLSEKIGELKADLARKVSELERKTADAIRLAKAEAADEGALSARAHKRAVKQLHADASKKVSIAKQRAEEDLRSAAARLEGDVLAATSAASAALVEAEQSVAKALAAARARRALKGR